MVQVIKRNGNVANFEKQKIIEAILSASRASNENIPIDFCETVANNIEKNAKESLTITEIQEQIENDLMLNNYIVTAKKYIIYRSMRDAERKKESSNIRVFNEIIEIADNEINKENANINSATPAGMMMKFASETTKEYSLNYLINPEHAKAHKEGLIHIHDLDYYPSGSATCCQTDLIEVLSNGFETNDGPVREPKSIKTAAQLAAIVLQCNQNEQHGGQSYPNFDYAMAKYVKKSFTKNFVKAYEFLYDKTFDFRESEIYIDNKFLKVSEPKCYIKALKETVDETYQAMEAFLHNMVTMHSRGGAQIVFSSINYGTDTSTEGRMVIKALLEVTEKGCGNNGSTFIFPVQVFKVKEGISYSESDYQKAAQNYNKAFNNEIAFSAKNFDLFLLACKVSAKRLFPNFVFLDATFNKNDLWKESDPNRYLYEACTMGCRTRVVDNLFGERSSVSRGNISFTTINIVRLAIEAKQKAEKQTSDPKMIDKISIEFFFKSLEKALTLVSEQLYARFKFQAKRKAKQFPFLYGQNIWKDGNSINKEDYVEPALKHGTLSIGFIGLAETLVILTSKHHGESKASQKLGLEIIKTMRNFCDNETKEKNLNYSLLATPAEGLSGRFVSIDKQKYGIIKGVTDKEYYTNSNHLPVYYDVIAYDKIKIESEYHQYTNAGHIVYVEMDTKAKKNLPAFIALIREMYYSNTGYGAINHEIQRCLTCGFEGEIKKNQPCPACGETDNIQELARITGYLVGTLEKWSRHKLKEKEDRIKHSLNSFDEQKQKA